MNNSNINDLVEQVVGGSNPSITEDQEAPLMAALRFDGHFSVDGKANKRLAYIVKSQDKGAIHSHQVVYRTLGYVPTVEQL